MSLEIKSARDMHIYGSTFNSYGPGNTYPLAGTPSRTVFDILKKQTAIHAVYNSAERKSEHGSACREGTCNEVLSKLIAWSKANDGSYPVCWLEGPAGSGKSTILHTIAMQCDSEKRLAFNFFFSGGKPDRSDATKVVPTFTYQLSKSLPAIQQPLLDVLTSDPTAPYLSLHTQFKRLILDPTSSIQQTIPPMVVIIDGLDECSDENLLPELIRTLVSVTDHLPFRVLFASRPEPQIRQTFKLIKQATFLSLPDYQTYDDVSNHLDIDRIELISSYKDLLELTRPGRKNLQKRKQALRATLLEMYAGDTDNLIEYLSEWPSKHVSCFLSELMKCLHSEYTGLGPLQQPMHFQLEREFRDKYSTPWTGLSDPIQFFAQIILDLEAGPQAFIGAQGLDVALFMYQTTSPFEMKFHGRELAPGKCWADIISVLSRSFGAQPHLLFVSGTKYTPSEAVVKARCRARNISWKKLMGTRGYIREGLQCLPSEPVQSAQDYYPIYFLDLFSDILYTIRANSCHAAVKNAALGHLLDALNGFQTRLDAYPYVSFPIEYQLSSPFSTSDSYEVVIDGLWSIVECFQRVSLSEECGFDDSEFPYHLHVTPLDGVFFQPRNSGDVCSLVGARTYATLLAIPLAIVREEIATSNATSSLTGK